MKRVRIFFVMLATFSLMGVNTYAMSHPVPTESSASTSLTTQATITNVQQLGYNLVKVTIQDEHGCIFESQTAVDAVYAQIGQRVEIQQDPNNPQGFLVLYVH